MPWHTGSSARKDLERQMLFTCSFIHRVVQGISWWQSSITNCNTRKFKEWDFQRGHFFAFNLKSMAFPFHIPSWEAIQIISWLIFASHYRKDDSQYILSIWCSHHSQKPRRKMRSKDVGRQRKCPVDWGAEKMDSKIYVLWLAKRGGEERVHDRHSSILKQRQECRECALPRCQMEGLLL